MTQKLKDNLRFEEGTNGVVFHHYSFCELIKQIMVKYGGMTDDAAQEKLQNHFLYEVPKSLDNCALITHELEYHWAMLLVYGDQYWLKGIASDYNNFRDEYLTWESEIRARFQLKESYIYYTVKTDENISS